MEKDAPKAISAEKRNKSTKSKKSKGKKKKKNKGKINNRINMAIGIHEKESDDRNLKVVDSFIIKNDFLILPDVLSDISAKLDS